MKVFAITAITAALLIASGCRHDYNPAQSAPYYCQPARLRMRPSLCPGLQSLVRRFRGLPRTRVRRTARMGRRYRPPLSTRRPAQLTRALAAIPIRRCRPTAKRKKGS